MVHARRELFEFELGREQNLAEVLAAQQLAGGDWPAGGKDADLLKELISEVFLKY